MEVSAYGNGGDWEFNGVTRQAFSEEPSFSNILSRNASVHHLALSPDDRWLATASNTNRIVFVDLKGHRETIGSIMGPLSSTVSSLAVDETGEYIAGGYEDGSIHVWSLEGNSRNRYNLGDYQLFSQKVALFEGHRKPVHDVVFSADGRWIASASSDSTAGLWDIKSGREIARFKNPAGAIYSVALSADGSQLFAGTEEGDILKWSIDVGTWQQEACALAGGEVVEYKDSDFEIFRKKRSKCTEPRYAGLSRATNQEQVRESNNLLSLSCPTESVNVDLFPLPSSYEELQHTVNGAIESVLEGINQRTSTLYDDVEISQVDKGVLDRACTLPRYKAVLIDLPTQNKYMVKGFRLNNTNRANAQLAITFSKEAAVVQLAVIDDNQRAEQQSEVRLATVELPGGEEVLDLIQELESAYETVDSTETLGILLDDAEIWISILRNGIASTRLLSSPAYINNLRRMVELQGRPKVTFENVNIYPRQDEFGNASSSEYLVNAVQVWEFPGEASYRDSDWISFNVSIDPEISIRARYSGRGSFDIQSTPSGAYVTNFDNQDWSSYNVKTPVDFMSVALQEHYLKVDLGNVWYEPEYVTVTSRDVMERRSVSVTMQHMKGQILLLNPPDTDDLSVFVQINGEFVETTLGEDGLLIIPVDAMEGVPQEEIESNERTVNLRITGNGGTFERTISLWSPAVHPVDVQLQ